MLTIIKYEDLDTHKQKKDYNFQKIAARLANYGFNCLRQTNDVQGADFTAHHISGETLLNVKIETRLTINRKFERKGLYVAFIQPEKIRGEKVWEKAFLYNHDGFISHTRNKSPTVLSGQPYKEDGLHHWWTPPKWALECIIEL